MGMLDEQDTALLIRIVGIVVSLASAVVLLFKPLELVTNTYVGYVLLIASALLVMIGQLITIKLNTPGDFKNEMKRHEANYDAVTIGVVMVLFIIFYVIPFVSKHAV